MSPARESGAFLMGVPQGIGSIATPLNRTEGTRLNGAPTICAGHPAPGSKCRARFPRSLITTAFRLGPRKSPLKPKPGFEWATCLGLAAQGRSRTRLDRDWPAGLLLWSSLLHYEGAAQWAGPKFTQVGTDMALPLLSKLWFDDQGQDVAEYAVTLAVILVIVAGTIRLVASNTNVVLWSSSSSVH